MTLGSFSSMDFSSLLVKTIVRQDKAAITSSNIAVDSRTRVKAKKEPGWDASQSQNSTIQNTKSLHYNWITDGCIYVIPTQSIVRSSNLWVYCHALLLTWTVYVFYLTSLRPQWIKPPHVLTASSPFTCAAESQDQQHYVALSCTWWTWLALREWGSLVWEAIFSLRPSISTCLCTTLSRSDISLLYS